MAALRTLLADNSELVRKMYDNMDTAVLELTTIKETIKKSLDLVVQDLKEGRWDKFPGTISVSYSGSLMHGLTNRFKFFVYFGN